MSIPIEKVNTDGFTMNYFKFGSGEKTFVILPGLSIQSVMGAAQIIADAYEIIAREFTVYVIDRKEKLPASYSVYDMAEDTAQAFRFLGLKDVYLFGASQGGMIGMVLAARSPKLVKKLVLGSSAARVTEKHIAVISKWIELAKEKERVKLSVEMGKDIYPESVFEQYKETLEKIGETITDEELEHFTVLAEGTNNFDFSDGIKNINCPVLSIGETDDKVLSGAAEEIKDLMSGKPNFESYMYSGFGHAAFDTAPDYKERMLKFFN